MSTNRIDDHKLLFHPGRVARWAEEGDCFPIYVEIGLTNRCNHRCCFCALDWLDHKKGSVFFERTVLLTALAEMAANGVKSLMFAGEGESLLHRDAPEFIRFADEHGIKVAITTNGVPLLPAKAEQILPHLSWLRFSLNAGTAATYAQVHGTQADDFDRVLANLAFAAQFKKEHHLAVDIGVQALLLPENASELLGLAAAVKAAGADNFQVKPYSQHPSSKNTFQVDYATYETLEKALKELEDESFTIFFRKNTMERIQTGNDYEACHGLPFFALITAPGQVIPCNLFYNQPEFSYGDLNQLGFTAIWQGEQRRQVLRKLAALGVKECRLGCRLDPINRYLERIKNPEPRDVFI